MDGILKYIECNFNNVKEINEDGADLENLLKKCLNEDEIICINDCLKSFWKQQIIQHFIHKYKMYIEYTFLCRIDGEFDKEKLYIKLSQGANIECNNYKELKGCYDSEYYLTDCGGFDIFNKYDGKELPNRLLDIFKMVNPSNGEKVLDIGCGRGELSYFLSCAGAEVLGVDYSQDSINIAQNVYGNNCSKNLTFVCEDIFQINELRVYDKIIMADVVEHIEQEKLEQLIEKISDMLIEGGILFIHTAPNREYYEKYYLSKVEQAQKLGAYLPKNPRTYYEELMHINEQTPNELQTSLKNNFRYVKVWTGGVNSILDVKSYEESVQDIDIFAIATNGDKVLEEYLALYNCYPEEDKVAIKLTVFQEEVEGHLGEIIKVKMNIENIGIVALNSGGKYPINISYHIIDSQNNIVVYDGIRTPLKKILKPKMNEETEIEIRIPETMDKNMKYKVQITLVAENYFWFENISKNYSKEIYLNILS